MSINNYKNFVGHNHYSFKRNYLKRVNKDKPNNIKKAKKYSFDYWDGSRDTGYGGYKYIQNYWKKTAKKIILEYNLKKNQKILDIGCGKGFLLFEMLKINPNLNIVGIDISKYALRNAKKHNKISYKLLKAQDKLPFKKNEFDLTISLGTLHNLEIYDLKKSINDINKVSKKSYIMVESYRNIKELFNLQCWALTCESFFSTREWIWLFREYNYKGDYEFIYFK